ncbi:MAG: hypothetical protein KAQ83_04110 [Nanoarchaeota archaeon]|nr:hypothetical protein [Nanoarchaeota archaeon]
MAWVQYLVIIGAIAQLWGSLVYVKETLAGRAKPNRVTWLMWAIAPLIASVAAFMSGVTWAVLPVFMAGFGPFLVFISSFFNKKAYWKLGKWDYLCGLFSVLALVLWGITKNPSIAILFAIISDGCAAIPTAIKSWKYPETEHYGAYAASLFSVLLGFFAIKSWNFIELAFPIYLIFICGLLLRFILRKRF